MWALIGETVRLLVTHLHLFTLISLTVWLPSHVLANYFEFFEPGGAGSAGEPAASVQVVLFTAVVFDPLVVAAALSALGRIKAGLPVGYGVALAQGLSAWPRLLVVRFVLNFAMVLPVLLLIQAARALGPATVVLAVVLPALAIVNAMILVRFAVVDAVVVLEGRNAVTAWRRAAELTAGRRWAILWTLAVLFGIGLLPALAASESLRAAPALNHFVVRVLVDCVLSVALSLFTIALFLFYWRARGPGAAAVAGPAAS